MLVDEVERVAGEDDLLARPEAALHEEGVGVACMTTVIPYSSYARNSPPMSPFRIFLRASLFLREVDSTYGSPPR